MFIRSHRERRLSLPAGAERPHLPIDDADSDSQPGGDMRHERTDEATLQRAPSEALDDPVAPLPRMVSDSSADSPRSRNSTTSRRSSVDSPRSRALAAGVLPDLTNKLVKAGIYEEYLDYRDNYRKWRKGGNKGAKGELSDVGKKDPYQFELWFPTPQKYHFFFTVSYWQAVLSLEGSLFFTFCSALPYVSDNSAEVLLLSNWCTFIGSTIFSAAVYCCYLELINLRDVERVYLFPSISHWTNVLQHVRWDSFMGTVSYVVGSILFQAIAIFVFLPNSGLPQYTPLLGSLGGLSFFIGGLCEVSHTCAAHHGTVLGSLVAWANCAGGLCFFLGGAAELLPQHHIAFIQFVSLVGCVLYTLAAALLLLMWQGNDFGGTLLNQLNSAICAGNVVSIDPSESRGGLRVQMRERLQSSVPSSFGSSQGAVAPAGKLSLRDVISLCIYCWLFVCSTANFVLGVIQWPSGGRPLADVAMTLIWVLGVKVILVFHSAITTVPNEQPYRFAMQSMWILLLLATAAQTLGLVSSLPMSSGPTPGSAAGAPTGGAPRPHQKPHHVDEL